MNSLDAQMLSVRTLVLAFAFFGTAFGIPFRNCGLKVATPVNNYNNTQFSQQSWEIKYIPDYADFKNLKSIQFTGNKPINNGCSARNIITYIYNDGSQSPLNIDATFVGIATIFEIVLDDSYVATGETNIVTFYGYKPGYYAQYHICTLSYAGGQEVSYDIDFRYVFVKKGYKLTAQDIREIKDNDKKQNFQGGIRKLGKQKLDEIDSSE